MFLIAQGLNLNMAIWTVFRTEGVYLYDEVSEQHDQPCFCHINMRDKKNKETLVKEWDLLLYNLFHWCSTASNITKIKSMTCRSSITQQLLLLRNCRGIREIKHFGTCCYWNIKSSRMVKVTLLCITLPYYWLIKQECSHTEYQRGCDLAVGIKSV